VAWRRGRDSNPRYHLLKPAINGFLLIAKTRAMGRWQNPRRSAGSAPLRLGNVVNRDVDDGARPTHLITIESLRRCQPADFALRLSSCRFHERKFASKSGQQKPLEKIMFSRG
jgi:hypothetical protein